jgi:hypothetical protein
LVKAKKRKKWLRRFNLSLRAIPVPYFSKITLHLPIIPAKEGAQSTARKLPTPVVRTINHTTEREMCDGPCFWKPDIKRVLATRYGPMLIDRAPIRLIKE